MSVELPAAFPRAPRLFPQPTPAVRQNGQFPTITPFSHQNRRRGPSAPAPLLPTMQPSSSGSSRSGSPKPSPGTGLYPARHAPSTAASSPGRYRSSSAASDTARSRASPSPRPGFGRASSRNGSAYSSRRSSFLGRFPVVVDGETGSSATAVVASTPSVGTGAQSHRLSRVLLRRPSPPTGQSGMASSTPSQPAASQPVGLQDVWPTLHSAIVPHLTGRDLMQLRLTAKSFSPSVSPRLFEHVHIKFSRAALRPCRVFTLKHVGHHVRTVTFQVPHSAEMVLPPLVDDRTGAIREFTYQPDMSNVAHALAGVGAGRSDEGRYGSAEIAALLIEKYPPLFHLATNVGAFADLFSAFPELVHLIVSCPGQRPAERLKMSIVDYALISVRIAVEQARLPRLTRLSISRIHAAGLRHLHPVHGAGCTAAAVARWSQIRTLDMIIDVLPVTGSPPLVRAIAADADSLLMVREFIAYFAPVVERLGFSWYGGRGPNVLTVGRASVCVADSSTIAAPVVPTATMVPAESARIGSGLFGRRRFPAISRPEPSPTVSRPQSSAAPPPTGISIPSCTLAADVVALPQLAELRLRQVADSARNMASLLHAHRASLAAFSLEEIGLASGSWTDVLAPLTAISGSTDWRHQVEAALAGMTAVSGARVKIAGGGPLVPKHVLVVLLADAVAELTNGPPARPLPSQSQPQPHLHPVGHQQPLAPYQQMLAARAHAAAAAGAVASSAASAISSGQSVTSSSASSLSSRPSSVVTSSATSCYSVCPPKPGPAVAFPPVPTGPVVHQPTRLRPASFVGHPAVRLPRPTRSTTISTPSPTVYGPFSALTPMVTITEARTPTSPGKVPIESVDSVLAPGRSRSGSNASACSTASAGGITINLRRRAGSVRATVADAARPMIAELASTLPPVEGKHPMHRMCDAEPDRALIDRPTARQIEAAVRAASQWQNRRSMVAEFGFVEDDKASESELELDGDEGEDDDVTPVPGSLVSPVPAPALKVEIPGTAAVKEPLVRRGLKHFSSLAWLRRDRDREQGQPLRLRQLALVSGQSPDSGRAASTPTTRPTSPHLMLTRPARHSFAAPDLSRGGSIRSTVPSIQEEDESVSPADYCPEDDAEVAAYLREVAARPESESESESDLEDGWDVGRPRQPPCSPAVSKAPPMPSSPPPPVPPIAPMRRAGWKEESLHVITRPGSPADLVDRSQLFVPTGAPITGPDADWMCDFAVSPGTSPVGLAHGGDSDSESEYESEKEPESEYTIERDVEEEGDDTDMTVLAVPSSPRSAIYRGPIVAAPSSMEGPRVVTRLVTVPVEKPSRVHRALTRAKSAFKLNVA